MENCQQQLEALFANENINAFTALTLNQIKIPSIYTRLCNNVYMYASICGSIVFTSAGIISIKLAIVGQVSSLRQICSSYRESAYLLDVALTAWPHIISVIASDPGQHCGPAKRVEVIPRPAAKTIALLINCGLAATAADLITDVVNEIFPRPFAAAKRVCAFVCVSAKY